VDCPVEVQLVVRWVGGKDLWKQVSFKSGTEERGRDGWCDVGEW